MNKQNKNKNKSHLFENGGFGDFGVSGTVGFVNGMKSTFDDVKQKSNSYNDQIANSQITDLSNINDLDTLENYSNSIIPLDHVTTNDLSGNTKQRLGRYLSTSGQAAQAGMNYGPWGLLVGSVVGQIGAGLSDTFSRKKARKEKRELNERIDFVNEQNQNMLANKANNIMQNQLNDQQWNYIAALGGNLHSNSTTWNNGLNYIGNGGSHESNPNDGVAVSTAPDGLQNKVEEGEVIWNDDYVFSRRLKVPKKDLEKNKWKGETYADIAKKLMDESAERPNDPITLRGLDDSLSRLRDSQDELKAKQEGNKIKKEIASMPPELLAQIQQQAQQPTEEEMMQQQAMEQMPQEQMPMVDPSMQQPTIEQLPMYAKGGRLFASGGGSVKAVSGKGFIAPLPSPQLERIGSTKIPTLDEMESAKINAMADYINKKAEYVNVNDAQKYGGFYDNANKINEYLDGSTPMDVKNIAQGVANQQSKESGEAFINRFPVKKNYGLGDNAYVLNKDNQKSVDFFLKSNPNLNLDSDTIYFYSKDKNDTADKNKSIKANKVKKEIYDKNSVGNIKEISGIDFNRTNMKAKGGYLHAENPYIWNSRNSVIPDIENYLASQNLIKAAYVNDILENEDGNVNYNENRRLDNLIDNARAINDNIINVNKKSKEDKKEDKEKGGKSKFDSTYLRYAPVVGSAIGAISSMLNKPDYGNPKRIERIAKQVSSPVSPKYIGDYLPYKPLDNAYYLNRLQAQQNANNAALAGLANGNRSMASANLLASNYNYNNAVGDAIRQGEMYNTEQRQRAAEFNRGTNQFNAQQYIQAAAQNASNRAQAANLIASAAQMREGIDNAYGASQSANWTNLFNNLGNVGKDEANRKMTKDLFDYGWGKGFNKTYNGATFKHGKTNNRRKE